LYLFFSSSICATCPTNLIRLNLVILIILTADLSDRAVRGVGLWLLDCWDRGLEPRWRFGCSSLLFVVCFVGSGLCDKLISCSEDSYRLCVWSRNLRRRRPRLELGWYTTEKN
jgi:hypothetical protein